jgi:hypothetical protein
MRRIIIAVFVCALFSVGMTYASSGKPEKKISAQITNVAPPAQEEQPLGDMEFDAKGTGTIMYDAAETKFFFVVETNSKTVGVLFVTTERLKRSCDTRPDFAQIIELDTNNKDQGDKVLSYFVLRSPFCGALAIDSKSCDFKKFVEDIMARLARIPEFSSICFIKFDEIDPEAEIPCLKQ